jgi:tRNA (mo5U34)-methyltransferase
VATALRERVAALDWHHTIDLGNGIFTPGREQTLRKIPRLQAPEKLEGKTVLDIGTADGALAFEAERRGASHVLALDVPGWDCRPFRLVHAVLDSRVETQTLSVHDISRERIGRFDLVVFLGVLYHLRDPFGAMQRVAEVTDELAVVETEGDMLHIRNPAAAFYPQAELNGDPTNWLGSESRGPVRHCPYGWLQKCRNRLSPVCRQMLDTRNP